MREEDTGTSPMLPSVSPACLEREKDKKVLQRSKKLSQIQTGWGPGLREGSKLSFPPAILVFISWNSIFGISSIMQLRKQLHENSPSLFHIGIQQL